MQTYESDKSRDTSQGVSFRKKETLPEGTTERVYYTHSKKGDLTEKCNDCHQIRLRGKADYRYIEQKTTCVTSECHQKMGKKKFLHGPMKEGKCLGCHNLHGTMRANYVTEKDANLCYRGHTTEKMRYASRCFR